MHFENKKTLNKKNDNGDLVLHLIPEGNIEHPK